MKLGVGQIYEKKYTEVLIPWGKETKRLKREKFFAVHMARQGQRKKPKKKRNDTVVAFCALFCLTKIFSFVRLWIRPGGKDVFLRCCGLQPSIYYT